MTWRIAKSTIEESFLVYCPKRLVILEQGLTEDQAHAMALCLNERRAQEEKLKKETTAQFDFESVYALYPRKLGKASGIKWCATHIKSEAAFNRFRLAVKNYADYVLAHRIDEQYIKHFDSFCRKHQDWIGAEETKPQGTTATQVNFSKFF